MDSIVSVEGLAHRTWPASLQDHVGDWILRANGGFTRRANSCLALGDPGLGIGCAISKVVSWYQSQEVEPCIKVAGNPEALDRELASRGWKVATPTRVLEIPTLASSSPPEEFSVSFQPDSSWLELLSRWDGEDPGKAAQHAHLLSRMPRAGYARWTHNGEILAVAVASLEAERCHLYDLVVREDRRGKGIGRTFFQSLLSWCHSEGARRAFLQVLESNDGARRLYERMGFSEHHRYHYRVAPGGSSPTSGC